MRRSIWQCPEVLFEASVIICEPFQHYVGRGQSRKVGGQELGKGSAENNIQSKATIVFIASDADFSYTQVKYGMTWNPFIAAKV